MRHPVIQVPCNAITTKSDRQIAMKNSLKNWPNLGTQLGTVFPLPINADQSERYL